MRTDAPSVRVPYVSGDVTPLVTATITRNYATWVPALCSVTISGNVCSDDFFDSGAKSCWWDSALNSNGMLLRIGNLAAIGHESSWLIGIGDANVINTDTDPNVGELLPYCRPGIISNNNTGYSVFYVGTDFKLCRQNLSATGVWGTKSSKIYLQEYLGSPVQPDACTVIPTSSTECFVVGYQNKVLWVCHYAYNVRRNTWSQNRATTLRADLDLVLADIGWCAAAPHPTESNLYVLIVPGGSNGCATSVIYDAAIDTYSSPYFVLATTGQDWLRRVWISGLNGPYNGRLWAVAETSLNNNGSAQHICLVSTTNGRSWRDEGFVSELEVRGRLLISGSTMTIASLCAVLHADAIKRIAGISAPGNETVISPQSINLSASGQAAAPTASLGFSVDDPLFEQGNSIMISIGALVTGTVTGSPVFTGEIDAITDVISVGSTDYTIEARGNLAKLIGETAYRPLTTLDWQGRNTFSTAFNELGVPAVPLVLDTESNWYAEYDGTQKAFDLHCLGAGRGLVPIPVTNQHLRARVSFKTNCDAGLVFFIADETQTALSRWELGLYGTNLEIRRSAGDYTSILASTVVSGYATGTHATIELDIMPDHITGRFVGLSDPTNWQSIVYNGWNPEHGNMITQSGSNTYGVFAGAGETRFYDLWSCDGGRPYNIQDALAAIADIAGIDTELVVATIYAGDPPIQVRSLDCQLLVTADGDGLYLPDYGCYIRVYADYLSADGIDGTIHYMPFNRTINTWTYVRIVMDKETLSLYQGDIFLGAIKYKLPKYAFGINVISIDGGYLLLPECYDPVQTGDTAWIAWDAMQTADNLLSGILSGRRIYLIEDGDGILHVRGTWPNGDILIGPDNPVGGLTAYRRAVFELQRTLDRRIESGLIAVTDINGNRVFLIEPEISQRSRSVISMDSQWAFTAADALREAALLRDDIRRRSRARMISGLWDPAMEIGDTFELDDIAWRGIIVSYTVTFERDSSGKISHTSTVNAESALDIRTEYLWNNADWGSAYWG